MNDLNLRLILRIAELGSISAAARDLAISPATASARLGATESELGVRLFHRSTRALRLSADGEAFLPHAANALESIEAAVAAASGRLPRVTGVLRFSMPGSFCRMHLFPALRRFRGRYPEVKLDLRLSDRVHDAVEEAYDLILRNAPLEDSSLISRKLAPDERILVASPDYLEARGAPNEPGDLTDHDCVILGSLTTWTFQSGQRVKVPATVRVDDGEALRLASEAGMGISIASLWSASASLKAGRLVRVLGSHPIETTSALWLLYPSGRSLPPKVRAMIDHLVEEFSPHPPWTLESEAAS